MVDHNGRIVIIDDDPGLREAFKEILTTPPPSVVAEKGAALFREETPGASYCTLKSYDVTLTENGEQGVAAVKAAMAGQRPYAVAFIEMNMPGINGAETARQMWAMDPKIKIVIVTAFTEYRPCDIIRIARRDDIFYLRKPFNPEEIRQFANALTHAWDIEKKRGILSGELKVVKTELEEMNRNLVEKVKEQTALLIQTEKMSTLGILAAGVAHEINNPLSFVFGNLDMICTYSVSIQRLLERYRTLEANVLQKGDKETIGLLEEINAFKEIHDIDFILKDLVRLAEESLDGTRRVGDIVRELRGFSHVDANAPSPVDLHNTMEQALHMIAGQLHPGTRIAKAYGTLPPVTCYPQKIAQVFLNLLMNAAQAVGKDGAIHISTHFLPQGGDQTGGMVEVCIKDNGHGIPQAKIPKIFDPFFTTKPVGQGTGLGLSISCDIVKSHGGQIMIESQEDAGTTVRVLLPLDSVIRGHPDQRMREASVVP